MSALRRLHGTSCREDKICDEKCSSADAKASAAVDKRAIKANREYLASARKPDADLGTPAETKAGKLSGGKLKI